MARIVSVSMTPPFLLFLSERLSRLLKKGFSCFDRLSTNGKSPTTSSLPPFALSLSKGERRVFQHPARQALGEVYSEWHHERYAREKAASRAQMGRRSICTAPGGTARGAVPADHTTGA